MSSQTRQRRESILARIYEQGHVIVKDLARDMGSSESTIRRDLRVLADERALELVHGGAVLTRSSDLSFRSKSMRNVEAKRVIGRLAADLVSDGDQILLDSGTTCFQMASFLRSKRGLLVIVNSTRLAMELNASGLSVILLGGQYRPARMDTIGPLATASLDQLRGYLAFIGADGLSVDFGLTAGDIDSADLYRLAVANARETVLLADHSKFQTPSLFKIVGFDAISRIVTDRQPPPEWTEFLESRKVQVIYPGEGPDAEDRGEPYARLKE
jgi:DeoR/GlpR family transcriptional regulator of sugar metabolism